MKRLASMVVVAVFMTAAPLARGAGFDSSAFLTNGVRGEEEIDRVGNDLEKISVFAYHITEQGDVKPPSPWVPEVIARLKSRPRGHLILTTINNRVLGPDGKLSQAHGGDTVQAILSDPGKRAAHIRRLAELASASDGIELNYERLGPDARDLFTDFVRDLRAAMPAGKKLSLVLQPKTDGANGSNGRAVDWRAVEPYADYMRIMAYYYAWSTSTHGPVVPLETLDRLADYALNDPVEKIPRHKLSIILSLWGWDWPEPEGTPGTLLQLAKAQAIAAAHGVTPMVDPQEQTLHFFYPGDDDTNHEVWIDGFEGARTRVELLQALRMPRVDIWHLNTGAPALWNFIASETAVRRARRSGLDFDGDGISDFAVFRPATGTWFVDTSHDGGTDLRLAYGRQDDIPVPADYDGDGVSDLAVFRPSYGGWFVDVDRDGGTDLKAELGEQGDIPVPADYDGDGATDFAVVKTSTGAWLVDRDHDGVPDLSIVLGQNGDVPVPGDYDGDGKADCAVFRPSTATWLIDSDRNGVADTIVVYGQSGDWPIPADYDGDGTTDLAVFRPSYARWFIDLHRSGHTDIRLTQGRSGDVPVPGNHDGDGLVDLGVFRPTEARWLVNTNLGGGSELDVVYGRAGDVPLRPNGWILDAAGRTR